MKKIFLLLFMCCLFQAKAQITIFAVTKELSETQIQQLSSVETVYKNALEEQTVDFLYKDYMLEISLDGDMCQLPLVDIESISVEETNGSYFLKLRHLGGWEYKGFYKMQNQAKAETVKAKLQQFLDDFEPFDEKSMSKLCQSLRNSKEDLLNNAFYQWELRLLRISGMTDEMLKTVSNDVLREAMQKMWLKHHKDLECPTQSYWLPLGNYFRQLAANNQKRPFLLLLRFYKLDPNVIDHADGCSALDFIEEQIGRTEDWSPALIEMYKTYAELMRKAGAKKANEICGCTSC